jgi:hypothetical protein
MDATFERIPPDKRRRVLDSAKRDFAPNGYVGANVKHCGQGSGHLRRVPRDGFIVFCVVQNTYKRGWLSVERLLDAVANRPLPRVIDAGATFVDRRNIDAYKGIMEAENSRQL